MAMQTVCGMASNRNKQPRAIATEFIECERCGFEFEAPQGRHLCDECRDAAKVKKPVRHVQTLTNAEYTRIAGERKGMSYNTARYEAALTNSSYEPFNIGRTHGLD